MSAALATVHRALADCENDVRSLPDLLQAMELIGSIAHQGDQGLSADECRGVARIASIAFRLASANVALWEQLFELTKGGAA